MNSGINFLYEPSQFEKLEALGFFKKFNQNRSTDFALDSNIAWSRPHVCTDYNTSDFFICYFGILGYVTNLNMYGEDYFLKIINATMETLDVQYHEVDKTRWGYRIFSDNIVIYAKKSSNPSINRTILLSFLKDIYIMQRNFMGQYRIFLRGGISEVPFFFDDKFVFGSGLISAYEIENKIAIYPRIIISSDLIGHILEGEDDPCSDLLKRILARDTDNEYFIGYLNSLGPYGYASTGYVYFHRQIIQHQLASLTHQRVIDKYEWCRKYHNSICELYELTDLLI